MPVLLGNNLKNKCDIVYALSFDINESPLAAFIYKKNTLWLNSILIFLYEVVINPDT